MLGRKAVIHRNNDAARCIGEAAAEPVMRVEIADHETAAMEKHERRQSSVFHGTIYADRDWPAWARDSAILHLRHRFFGSTEFDHSQRDLASFRQGELFEWRSAKPSDRIEE